MKQIPLTQGKVALVDDDDYQRLSQHPWIARWNGHDWFAARLIPQSRSYLMMHREILGITGKTNVRFRDGNTLNLQRSNLTAGCPSLLDGPYPNSKLIPLPQGKFTIVDADLAEYLSQWKWSVRHEKSQDSELWYAVRFELRNGKHYSIRMHRVVMGATETDLDVDHYNNDGLDNRRSNLRFCTQAQNSYNMRTHSASGFKGVHCRKRTGSKVWQASITYNRKSISLGYYATAEEAARAYDAKALELFGDFAHLNFPTEVTAPN